MCRRRTSSGFLPKNPTRSACRFRECRWARPEWNRTASRNLTTCCSSRKTAPRKCSPGTDLMLAELAQGIAIFAHGLARNFELGLERNRRRRFRCRLIARKIEQHEHGDGREKIGDEDRSGVARSVIPRCHDIRDVDDAGAHQESGGGERSRKPRLVALEGG